MEGLGLLDGTGDGESSSAGGNGIGTGCGILGVGGCGNRDLTGNGGKQAGSRGVVVLDTLGPGGAVEGNHQVGQNGIESVGDDSVIRSHHGGIAEVLDHEGIGQAITVGDRGGRQGLVDGQEGLGGGSDGFGCTNGCGKTSAKIAQPQCKNCTQ